MEEAAGGGPSTTGQEPTSNGAAHDGDHGVPALRLSQEPQQPRHVTRPAACAVVALATLTGFLTGFFGVGGGFAIVPALHLALRYPMKRASATSLLVMVITAVFGLASRTLAGTLTITAEAGVMVALFTAASMGGGFVGAKLTTRVSNRVLGLVFAALLVCVAVSTLAATLA